MKINNLETYNYGSRGLNTLKSIIASGYKKTNKFNIYSKDISSNPAAISILLKDQSLINWKMFSSNIHPKAIDLLIKQKSKIDWSWFSANGNPKAVRLLLQNPLNIDYEWFCLNPNPIAVSKISNIAMSNPNDHRLSWRNISKNPGCGDLLKHFIDSPFIDWDMFSKNPGAVDLIIEELKHNDNRISWSYLSSNPHPKIIDILKMNLDKVNWRRMSANPAAIEIMKDNPLEVHWNWLSSNPAAIDWLVENPHKIYANYMVKHSFWNPFYHGSITSDNIPRFDISYEKALSACKKLNSNISNYDRLMSFNNYISQIKIHEDLEHALMKKFNVANGRHLNDKLENANSKYKQLFADYKLAKDIRIAIVHALHISYIENTRFGKVLITKQLEPADGKTQDIHIEALQAVKMIQVIILHKQAQHKRKLLPPHKQKTKPTDYENEIYECRNLIAHSLNNDVSDRIDKIFGPDPNMTMLSDVYQRMNYILGINDF